MCAGSCAHHQQSTGSLAGIAESWVGSVTVCRGSDLAASGAGDGFVRLWAMEDTNRSLQALHKLPVVSFSCQSHLLSLHSTIYMFDYMLQIL